MLSALTAVGAAAGIVLVPLALWSLGADAPPPSDDTPIELGDVAWHRNLDDALPQAKVIDKPILLLFQEVPG